MVVATTVTYVTLTTRRKGATENREETHTHSQLTDHRRDGHGSTHGYRGRAWPAAKLVLFRQTKCVTNTARVRVNPLHRCAVTTYFWWIFCQRENSAHPTRIVASGTRYRAYTQTINTKNVAGRVETSLSAASGIGREIRCA